MDLLRMWGLVLMVWIFSISLTAGEIKVTNTKGEILFKSKLVKKGDILMGEGLLETRGKKSYVDIVYPEGHTLRISDAKIRLKPHKEKEVSSISLIKGKLFAYIVKGNGVSKEAVKFRVQTKTAVAGVRGTKFMIDEQEEKAYFCVCDGKINVSQNKNENEVREIKTGEDIWIKVNKPMGDVVKASDNMMNMAMEQFKEMGHPVN